MYENSKNARRSSGMCYRCGKHGHFIVECPEVMEIKNDYKGKPKHDYNKHRSRNDYKDKHKDKGERRHKKGGGYKKKTARAMVAGASDIDSTSSDASSDSSSEDEQEKRKCDRTVQIKSHLRHITHPLGHYALKRS